MSSLSFVSGKTASNKTDRSSTRRTGGINHSFGVDTEYLDSGAVDDFKHEEGLARPVTARRRTQCAAELIWNESDGDFRQEIEEQESRAQALASIGQIDVRDLIAKDRELAEGLCLLLCLEALEHDLCECDHSKHECCEICCVMVSSKTVGIVENDHQGGQITIQISGEIACSEEIGFMSKTQLAWLRGQFTQGKKAILHGEN